MLWVVVLGRKAVPGLKVLTFFIAVFSGFFLSRAKTIVQRCNSAVNWRRTTLGKINCSTGLRARALLNQGF